jgi:hypothetical protein
VGNALIVVRFQTIGLWNGKLRQEYIQCQQQPNAIAKRDSPDFPLLPRAHSILDLQSFYVVDPRRLRFCEPNLLANQDERSRVEHKFIPVHFYNSQPDTSTHSHTSLRALLGT